jgi:cell volume regulation protein A
LMFAGLKGAVPLLLGSFILSEHVADAERLYGIVVIVVMLSVVGQGSLVPTVARMLHVPMREVEPEPWALGVRLRDEPNGVHRLTVAPGSPADGSSIADLTALPEDVWVSFVVRSGRLVPVSGTTVLEAYDEALVLGDPGADAELRAVFEGSEPGE